MISEKEKVLRELDDLEQELFDGLVEATVGFGYEEEDQEIVNDIDKILKTKFRKFRERQRKK